MRKIIIGLLTLYLYACTSSIREERLSVMDAMLSETQSFEETLESSDAVNTVPEVMIDVHPFVTKMESAGSAWEEIGLEVTNKSSKAVVIEKTYILHGSRVVGINYYSYSVGPFLNKIHDIVHFDSDGQVYHNVDAQSRDQFWKELKGVVEIRIITSEGDIASGFINR